MKKTILYLAAFFILNGCSKEQPQTQTQNAETPTAEPFTQYNIAAGAHYCDLSVVAPVNLASMQFKVRFDSSAVYATADPLNQLDINKLYGFTEGYDPHINSARIGWSYNNGKLRLYAYVYNNQQRISQEICPVNLFDTINCSIRISNTQYIFLVNDTEVRLSRAVPDPIAQGYRLFPYFGGDETAPHPIRIWIKDL